MAMKESAHCFQLSSLEFWYCSTLSSTLETLGFKTHTHTHEKSLLVLFSVPLWLCSWVALVTTHPTVQGKGEAQER